MTSTGVNSDTNLWGPESLRPSGASAPQRSRTSILGVLHGGFGFGSQAILEESKVVARNRSKEAEVSRTLASQVKLEMQDVPVQRSYAKSPGRSGGEFGPKADSPTLKEWSALSQVGSGSVPRPSSHTSGQSQVSTHSVTDVEDRSLRLTLGKNPSRFSVSLAVGVDASFSFATLAAADLLAQVGGWTRSAESLFAGRGWFEKLSKNYAQLQTQFASMSFPELSDALHWFIVAAVWASAVLMVQIAFMAVFRGTLGRSLVGIGVNPVASERRGTVLVPLFEVLTFGGLFSLPVALIRPDKHIFLKSVRFHS